MTQRKEPVPSCFGCLDSVFPMGDDGLRNTPNACLTCSHKTACLKSAMEGEEGVKIREGYVDRAYASGMIGFIERWSRKKILKGGFRRRKRLHLNKFW